MTNSTDRVRGDFDRIARVSRELRQAWREHGASDVYLTLDEARRVASRVLPGARVTPRLFWRYLLQWDRPTGP